MATDRRHEPARRGADRWELIERRVKDAAMFLFGAVGFFHELLVRGAPNLTILVASGALMGVPLVMSADAKKRNGEGGE